MAHIHEPRLPSPTLSDFTTAHPRTATTDSPDEDSDVSPLSYAQFSTLIQQTLDGVALSDLIVIKRSDWEAQQQKLRQGGFGDGGEEEIAAGLYDLGIQNEIGVRVEKVKASIENTYERLLKVNREELAERYEKELKKLRKRVVDLEIQKQGFKFFLKRKGSSNGTDESNSHQSTENTSLEEALGAANCCRANNADGSTLGAGDEPLAQAKARILDLETQVSCLKQILSIRLTDRATNITNSPPSGAHVFRSTSGSMFDSISNPPRHASPLMAPETPRIIANSRVRVPVPALVVPSRHTSNNVSLPKAGDIFPRLTTSWLISETASFRRVLYITKLGPNFSLTSVLSCVTSGAIENVMPFFPRGSCLLFFVRPCDAKKFFTASHSPNGPFENKYPAVVRWANYAVSKMDWIIASSIISQGATRILRVKGLNEGTRKEEIESWWGGMSKFLIGIEMVMLEEVHGNKVWAAEIECMSVRDATWRWRVIVDLMKKGKITGVSLEWVQDYCGREQESSRKERKAVEGE